MGWGGGGGGGAGSDKDVSCIVSRNVVQKSLMFLHSVNNKEHHKKQNTYIDMEVISLMPS